MPKTGGGFSFCESVDNDYKYATETDTLSPLMYLFCVWNLFVAGDTFPNKTHWWVDVRDVAMAHIQAYELLEASGRYCLVGSIFALFWDNEDFVQALPCFKPTCEVIICKVLFH